MATEIWISKVGFASSPTTDSRANMIDAQSPEPRASAEGGRPTSKLDGPVGIIGADDDGRIRSAHPILGSFLRTASGTLRDQHFDMTVRMELVRFEKVWFADPGDRFGREVDGLFHSMPPNKGQRPAPEFPV